MTLCSVTAYYELGCDSRVCWNIVAFFFFLVFRCLGNILIVYLIVYWLIDAMEPTRSMFIATRLYRSIYIYIYCGCNILFYVKWNLPRRWETRNPAEWRGTIEKRTERGVNTFHPICLVRSVHCFHYNWLKGDITAKRTNKKKINEKTVGIVHNSFFIAHFPLSLSPSLSVIHNRSAVCRYVCTYVFIHLNSGMMGSESYVSNAINYSTFRRIALYISKAGLRTLYIKNTLEMDCNRQHNPSTLEWVGLLVCFRKTISNWNQINEIANQ